MQNEVWKLVVGYEGLYEVSNLGRVRNSKGHVMKPRLSKKKYHRVNLCQGGERKTFWLHRLVLEAFIGKPPEEKYECNHKNGDKIDNRVENLEYVSGSENVRHSYSELNRKGSGACVGQKLTPEQVHCIRASKASGTVLADMYKVSDTTISQIRNGKIWQHLPWVHRNLTPPQDTTEPFSRV